IFGRDRRWSWGKTTALSTTAGAGTAHPTLPPYFEMAYTHDAAGNRTSETDARPGASRYGRDRGYAYDGLYRLVEAKRSSATEQADHSSSSYISRHSQKWSPPRWTCWGTGVRRRR